MNYDQVLIESTVAHNQTKIEVRPKAAIIVLNWNGWKDTVECIESLKKIAYPNYKIILVDNGSTMDLRR